MLLESAQAGLSWSTILRKREGYRKAFDNFDFQKVADYDKGKLQQLLEDACIIRNRLKIQSAVKNAKAFKIYRKNSELLIHIFGALLTESQNRITGERGPTFLRRQKSLMN